MFSLTNLVYDPKHLEHLCVFDQEVKKCKKSLSCSQVGRIVCAIAHVLLIAGWYHLYGWGQFEQYLTNWGICIVLVSLSVSTYVPLCRDYKRQPGLMAFNHLMMSLSIVVELVVTFVYWTMVHKQVMKSNEGNLPAIYYAYAAHIIPSLTCLYNFLVTDFLFYRSYSAVLFILTGVYLSVNCIKTKLTGNIAYWFLRFDDMLSIYVVIFFMSAAIFIPFGLASLTEFVKGRKLSEVAGAVHVKSVRAQAKSF